MSPCEIIEAKIDQLLKLKSDNNRKSHPSNPVSFEYIDGGLDALEEVQTGIEAEGLPPSRLEQAIRKEIEGFQAISDFSKQKGNIATYSEVNGHLHVLLRILNEAGLE